MSGLDETDVSILHHLQEDGRLTNAKLSTRLSLSETPCWRRLKRLESEGFINSYQANLDRRKLGFGVLAALADTAPVDRHVYFRYRFLPGSH